jgi:phage terminase large subunit GpA-like protein
VLREASSVVDEAWLALKPPPRMKLSEWADAKYYLSAESAAEPGRWHTLPYQREPMDTITDPRVDEVSFLKSARVGYTKMIGAAIGYHVDYDPCGILVIQPTEDDAKGYSKEEIEPLLRDCPDVGDKFVKARNKVDSLLHKRFRGGILQLAGARSPGSFRRVSRRVIIGDEVDGYPVSAGKEGDPLKLADRRSEYFWNRKRIWGSTPTLAGVSRIEQKFFEGDQRRYYVPCPHCHETHEDGGMQVLVMSNLRWPEGRPDLASFACIHCGCEIEHAQKRWMVERGAWRPGPHDQFPNLPKPKGSTTHRSFHIWAAYSYSPNASWGQIATEFGDATKGGPEQLKTFVNTVLGETWKESTDPPDYERLYERRERYERGTCPVGVLFLTAAVDVQGNRLIYEVIGWGRGKENWSIEYAVIPGDTSNTTTNGPWSEVDSLLDRTFAHACGSELRIKLLAVDSSDQTQTVYNWARTKDHARVMVVKGNDSTSALIGSPSKVDVTKHGKQIGKLQLWRVGGPVAKGELYGWLKLQQPTDEQRAAGARTPPGYVHFPEYGEDYFKQLTAERLVLKTRTWEPIPGRENHVLDLRVYNRAAASLLGIDRANEANWRRLEREVGLETPPDEPPSTPPPTVSEPSAPVSSPRTSPRQPAADRQSSWLNRPQGSWLGRRRR